MGDELNEMLRKVTEQSENLHSLVRDFVDKSIRQGRKPEEVNRLLFGEAPIVMLVIDFDRDLSELFIDKLPDFNGTDYVVHYAVSLEEAVRAIQTGSFHLVVIDLDDDADGKLVKLSNIVAKSKTPILLVAEKEAITTAAETRADGFIPKDVLTLELLDRTIRYSINNPKDLILG